MKTNHMAVMVFSSALLLFVLDGRAADNIVGTWSDRQSNNIYNFIGGGEFEYYQKQTLKKDAKSPQPQEHAYSLDKGVWQQGKDICWAATNKGNLVIYVEDTQCCFLEQVIAEKLVLSKIFEKGNDATYICSNRVLNKISSTPAVKRIEIKP